MIYCKDLKRKEIRMKKLIQKIREKKGFTLAELLIVVAIIAVLVAIAIPVFTTQLEKSREGVDLANVRSAYAEVKSAALGDTKTYYKKVDGKQSTAGFDKVDISELAENLGTTYAGVLNTLKTGVSIYVICDSNGNVSIAASAPAGGTDVDGTT